jgi:HAD superfamily hydrolase (TIGR01509 family)
MSKKVLVFDMDGVLFDTIPYAEEVFLERHPGVTSEMYKEIHTGNFHEEAKKYSHLKKEETAEEKEKRSLAYAEKKKETSMFDGVKSLLEDLHGLGYVLVLNTNAFNKNCLPLLEHSEIKNLFDFIASADLSKNKTEKFKLIEEKYGVDKTGMIFITDALGDVREAEIAEVPTVAVTWGVHSESFFKRDEHPYLVEVIHTVKELRDFLFQ